MIPASRCSVDSKLHASRLAFYCISSALVANPPALATLPGPNRVPDSRNTRTPSGVIGVFAPSATAVTPCPTRV